MENNNLDTFMALLIKLIEKSDDSTKIQIDDLKKLVEANDAAIHGRVSSICKEVSQLTVTNAVSKYKFSTRAKLSAATITFLLTASMLLIRFKESIFNLFTTN